MQKIFDNSIKEAKKIMKKVPDSFHGGLEHTKKVVELSKEILKEEPAAIRDVVLLAAWWHDTGRLYTNNGHEKKSAQLAFDYFQKNGVDKDFCHEIYLAIAHHRFDEKPTRLEGVIVKDADKLALFDPKRWEASINDKAYHKFEHTIHVLPLVKKEILQRPVSLKIYNRVCNDFIKYIESVEDEGFQHKKEEILNLDI